MRGWAVAAGPPQTSLPCLAAPGSLQQGRAGHDVTPLTGEAIQNDLAPLIGEAMQNNVAIQTGETKQTAVSPLTDETLRPSLHQVWG